MFTPGDNDWTDCDRPSNGGFNSLERLDHERQLFFSTPFTLGQHRLRQEVQTSPLCLGVSGPTACVENRRWNVGGVTCDAGHPGLVQQPLRHRAGPGRGGCTQRGRHRLDAADLRRGDGAPLRRGDAHLAGRSRVRRDRWDTRSRSATPRRSQRRTDSPTASSPSCSRCATRWSRSEARRLRPRRLALLPHRQAVPQRAGPAARELHAGRDVRRPPGERGRTTRTGYA